MENKLIKTEINSHVAVVTMDAPPVNAQSVEFVEELMYGQWRKKPLEP